MNVIFTETPHHLQPLGFPKHVCLVSLRKLLGQSLIRRIIEILRRIYDIDIIRILDFNSGGQDRDCSNTPTITGEVRNKDLTPDCIISSVALRAKSNAKDYLNIIEGISDKQTRVLLVGHNPTVEEVIEMLTDSLDTIRMPPCALAHLNLQIEKWSDINKKEKIKGRVQLVNIWRKEDLPSMENNHKSNSS